MGESACWLHLTCRSCGTVSDRLDTDRHCPACRASTGTDTSTATTTRSPADQSWWEYLVTGPEVWSVRIDRRGPE